MKVVLVDPGYNRSGFGLWKQSYWTTTVQHGLSSISAYLKNRGHSVSLLDIRQLRDWNHFDDEFKKLTPDIVGITFRSADYHMVEDIVRQIRAINGKVKIVVGGAHPTADAEDALRIPGIDHAIIGEGEISFTEIVENPSMHFPRIIVGIHPDLNAIPFEDRELYNLYESMKLANYPGLLKPPFVTMITCRGCAFQCKYCAPHAENTFGKKMRYQSVDRVIEEIQIIDKKYHPRTLKFYNSDFPASRKWVYEFCDAMEKAGIKKDLMIQSRATSIAKDPEMLKRLKSVGLKLILFGFESGSQRILQLINKGGTVEHNLAAAAACKKHGVVFGASFMLGFPGETREDVMSTVKHAKEINGNFSSVSFLTPLPGTFFYDYVKKNDISLITDYDDYYTFTPEKPKIKGVDYEFAKNAVSEILSFRVGGVFGPLVRLIYVKTKNMTRLRNFLVTCFALYTTNPLIRRIRGS